MKVAGLMLAICLVLGLSGCAKTLGEIKADVNGAVDNSAAIAKKGLDTGFAVYDLVKKLLEDTKDNIDAVKNVL